jgi:hypothetical protein
MTQKCVDGVLLDMTEAEETELAADRATLAAFQAQRELLNELAALDIFIPRGLEDAWTAAAFDTATLPQIQQDRLARKIALRAQLDQST